jgi:DNA-binding NtrC family response regulator
LGLTQPEIKPRVEAGVSQQNERRILIVDDSESDRAAYIRYLQAEKNFSYQIIETDTLQAGLESWETHHPDLVLLDINLPDGNGLEFLQTIAQSYPDPKLPVIVMTGETDARVALDAIKLGASDYLFKDDTNAAVFRSCVSHTINQLELSRKLARSQQKDALKSQISLHIQTFSRLEDIYQTIVTEVRQFLKTDRVIIYPLFRPGKCLFTTKSAILVFRKIRGLPINRVKFLRFRIFMQAI